MPEPWVLGIEIGGTKLQLAIGDGQGSVAAFEPPARRDIPWAHQEFSTRSKLPSPLFLKSSICQGTKLTRSASASADPSDTRQKDVDPKILSGSGLGRFPLTSWLRSHLGSRLAVLENDADAAGLAESRFGEGRGCSPLLYVTVGSGIGGSLIIDGRIYRGSGQGAAELGHLRVPDISSSGTYMLELEQVASGWAIASDAKETAQRMIKEGRNDWVVLTKARGCPCGITASHVAEAAGDGDLDSAAILDRACRAVSFALTQAITMLSPRRVVIGGGVSLIGEKNWFEPIRRLVDHGVFGLLPWTI